MSNRQRSRHIGPVCCALAILSVTCGFTTWPLPALLVVWLAISAAIAFAIVDGQGFWWLYVGLLPLPFCFPLPWLPLLWLFVFGFHTCLGLLPIWLRMVTGCRQDPVELCCAYCETLSRDDQTYDAVPVFELQSSVLLGSFCRHQLGACPCWSVLHGWSSSFLDRGKWSSVYADDVDDRLSAQEHSRFLYFTYFREAILNKG